MIKYSIVIPVYGCEKYLSACVESLLQQTYKGSYEILLIDDGSPDQSGKIADQLSAQYPLIRSYHKENGGAASARNRGIEEACGEYILFIDGDDTVDTGFLEAIDTALEKNRQALIIFGMSFDYYLNEKLERREKLSCVHEGLYSLEQVLEDYQMFFSDNALSSACNKVFSAEIIKRENLRFREGMTLYEDYDFILRYLTHTAYIICLDSVFYYYRIHLENAHINERVSDLVKLRANMAGLLNSSLALGRSRGEEKISSQLFHVSVDLYMQLLIQNLMIKKYSVLELQTSLTEYCSDESFRLLLSSGIRLSGYEGKLLDQIDGGEFKKIFREFQRRKNEAKIKKFLKRILRKAGLRR